MSQSLIHVAVGVVFNTKHEVLVTLRPQHVDQGGLWEFPGGKVEKNETVEQALIRELQEEVGILVTAAKPLIKINHEYPNKTVLLDVWRVLSYEGEPAACEQQLELKWVTLEALPKLAIPTANHPIVQKLLTIRE